MSTHSPGRPEIERWKPVGGKPLRYLPMKRYERINVLRDSGRIAEDKVLGLPKTKPVEM